MTKPETATKPDGLVEAIASGWLDAVTCERRGSCPYGDKDGRTYDHVAVSVRAWMRKRLEKNVHVTAVNYVVKERKHLRAMALIAEVYATLGLDVETTGTGAHKEGT